MENLILNVVSYLSGVSIKLLKSESRVAKVANARGVYYVLCVERGCTLQATADAVKRKTHSTVFLTARQYRGLIETKNLNACRLYEKTSDFLNSMF